MDKPKIITNHVPRFTVDGIDLTPKERKEFDYYSDEEIAFKNFVRYKGQVIDLSEVLYIRSGFSPDEFRNWEGYAPDSYFSGILVRYCQDHERVIMGRYYS